MQKSYKCPQCGKDVPYITNPCPNCKLRLDWRQQPPIPYIPAPLEAPQQQTVQQPVYQQPIQAPQQQVVQPPVEAPQQNAVQPDIIDKPIKKNTKWEDLTTKQKNTALGCISIVVLIVILFASVGVCSSSKSEPITLTYPKDSTEGKIESIIRTKLGTCNRKGINKIWKLEITSEGNNYIVDVGFSLDDNLDDKMTKGSAMTDVFNVMEALYTSTYKDSIIAVFMTGQTAMRDSYGNDSETIVLACELKKSTAEKINWANMYDKRALFKILDKLGWHTYFKAIIYE